MNETIHYVSPFSYIRDVSHLRKHIKYITRKGSKPAHTNIDHPENIKEWEMRAEFEKKKRHDAVIALKFTLALPNDQKNNVEFYKQMREFLSSFFDIDIHNIDVSIHHNEPENLHAHILIYPRMRNGKKLALKPKDLSEFHRKWDEFLQKSGYVIRRDDEEERLQHLGWRLHRDLELRESYIQYKKNKRQKRQIDTEIKRLSKEEREIVSKIQKIEYRIQALEQQIEKQKIKQKKAQRYKIRTMNKRFLFGNILNLLRAKKEIQKIEKQEREAREKLLLLDAVIHQLNNQKKILEEERKKKILEEQKRKEEIRNRKKIIFESKIQLVMLGKQFYELERESIKDLERKEKKPVIQHQEKPPQQTQQTQQTIKPQQPPATPPPKQQPTAQRITITETEDKEQEIKKIKKGVFGDDIYIPPSAEPKDQQVTRNENEQTEADIKWILFGIEPEPKTENTKENTEEKPPEEKPPSKFKDLYIDI